MAIDWTVVNRNEKTQGPEKNQFLYYGIYAFMVKVINNMGHIFTEHLFLRLGTFAF